MTGFDKTLDTLLGEVVDALQHGLVRAINNTHEEIKRDYSDEVSGHVVLVQHISVIASESGILDRLVAPLDVTVFLKVGLFAPILGDKDASILIKRRLSIYLEDLSFIFKEDLKIRVVVSVLSD
jgi:hypothetical protein